MDRELTEREKETLSNVNKRLYETTHDPSNKAVLPIAIFWSVICIIFKNPLFWEALVWTIYYLYCSDKNRRWEKLPNNIREREFLLGFKQELLEGKIDFPPEL